ncbi:CpaF family protein [Helcobacillus massiliensis]|uniref:CpaF family protein n=1 Tax=Helcobacillus massiliensis TaxID=521392 RepID=UPI0025566D61|nr:ATPase, T2SS/T4P/T4SS family [Helcobacillus massiliensis]MDK7742271.1 ATPase, T2SS/T4P/T4SS family [Helcobacillus massiliensis]WOO93523.1 ATPase, T2SS/T4P/T4SS family [Helcobacillus massiliensis]
MDAVAIIEAESRDSIRMRGIETGSDALEALIREVFADYEARAARGEVPTVRDPESVVSDVAARIGGFGPLQPFLDDPTVEEIWINSPTEVFVSRLGVAELTPLVLSDSQVRGLVERMLASSGRRIDLSTPFVDALLPDGSRLHAVIPHVTRQHISVNIRKFIARAHSLSDLVQLGTLTDQAARFLDAAVKAGLNILVSGSTSAGKTTTLNCLGAAVRPRERVITIEEVFELDIRVRDVVAMQTRQASLEGTGEISMRRLVKETLRMRPDRIIVGEVREAESLDMLIALNSGLPGMASIHANSARDAIGKLCTLPLLAGENVAGGFVIPTVASAIDLVVHQDLMPDGRRRIREIAAVPGRVEEGVVEIEKIFETRDGRLIRADGFPPHRDRFARAGHNLGELLGAA